MGIIGVALARNAQTARQVIIPFSCEANANIGDLVYHDPNDDLSVLVNTNNSVIYQTIGVVLEKPSPNDANILVLGIADGFSGLSVSGRIYLGTNGQVTQTIPTTDYVQNLGVAVSPTQILFIPSNERVKRL